MSSRVGCLFLLVAVGCSGESVTAAPSAPAETQALPFPPADAACDLTLGGGLVNSMQDTILVCVPGAYCPDGYTKGQSFGEYAATLRYPEDPWMAFPHHDPNSSIIAGAAGIFIGPHEIRLDRADALTRLDDVQASYPEGYLEQLTIQGRPAVRYSYRHTPPQSGADPALPSEQLVIGLDVVDGLVLAHLRASMSVDIPLGAICEVEAILASLSFPE